jgi:hypothetical protein
VLSRSVSRSLSSPNSLPLSFLVDLRPPVSLLRSFGRDISSRDPGSTALSLPDGFRPGEKPNGSDVFGDSLRAARLVYIGCKWQEWKKAELIRQSWHHDAGVETETRG